MIAYLIEYDGPKPFEIYVQDEGAYPVCNPWQARRWPTREMAEDWRLGMMPLHASWRVIEHAFDINCMYCGEDSTFMRSGDKGLCATCIPF